jgi:hypothetical protein
MPLHEPRVPDAEEQAEVVRRAVPHVMNMLKVLKLVVMSLLMMRFYKLGQHCKKVQQSRRQQQQQAASAAPAVGAKKASKGDSKGATDKKA